MARKIHSVLFRTLLMVVYAVFFSIQFFYNFDGHPNTLKYSVSTRYAGNGIDHAKSGPLRSSPPLSHTVRLNKRFHQENIPPCTVFSIEIPELPVVPKTFNRYRNPVLPSFTPVDRPLRGPPFAA